MDKAIQPEVRPLASGTFIRVRSDHPDWWRAGLDGMVIEDSPAGDTTVGLVFGTDRHNEFQHTRCVGTELWEKSELDTSTIA